jgi:hypothetical protein
MTPDEREALTETVREHFRCPVLDINGTDEVIWRASKAFWLERAAKVCDEIVRSRDDCGYRSDAASECAEAIRALAQEADK